MGTIDAGRPERKYPVHPPPIWRPNEPVVLLVTVCVTPRQPLWANAGAHQALRSAWTQADHWLVGEYVILPDHLHLFCVPAGFDSAPVKTWVRYWKRLAGKELPSLKSHWQEDCWDTQMRSRPYYEEKLAYVQQNAVRYGLVTRPEDWPYAGRLHLIEW